MQPNGVSGGTGNPVGPDPVRLAFRFGATVKTELNALSGKLLLEGQFPGNDLSYRSMVEPWVGLPLTSPAGAVRERDGRTTVYASWNGATRLVSWRVLAGSDSDRLSAIAHAAKTGFETAITVPSGYTRFEVQALDASGAVIGTSATVKD